MSGIWNININILFPPWFISKVSKGTHTVQQPSLSLSGRVAMLWGSNTELFFIFTVRPHLVSRKNEFGVFPLEKNNRKLFSLCHLDTK